MVKQKEITDKLQQIKALVDELALIRQRSEHMPNTEKWKLEWGISLDRGENWERPGYMEFTEGFEEADRYDIPRIAWRASSGCSF